MIFFGIPPSKPTFHPPLPPFTFNESTPPSTPSLAAIGAPAGEREGEQTEEERTHNLPNW